MKTLEVVDEKRRLMFKKHQRAYHSSVMKIAILEKSHFVTDDKRPLDRERMKASHSLDMMRHYQGAI